MGYNLLYNCITDVFSFSGHSLGLMLFFHIIIYWLCNTKTNLVLLKWRPLARIVEEENLIDMNPNHLCKDRLLWQCTVSRRTDNSLRLLARNWAILLELSSLSRYAMRLQKGFKSIHATSGHVARSNETRSRRVREVEGSGEIDVATDTRIDGSNITPSCRTGSILVRHQSSR